MSSEKPLALVIEDDLHLNDIISLSLAGQFQIEAFREGDAAFNRLDEVAPQLVVLDIHLPKVSGNEILKKIRSDARFDSTKVILTTADAVEAAALDAQADIVLLKPVSPNQLRELAARIAQDFK